MTSFAYYREAYGAVLDGMVGLYEIEIPKSEAPAFALADAQIQEGDPAANTSYATTPPTTTATTTGTDTIDSASQVHQKLQPHPTHKLLSKPQPPLSPIPTLSPDSLR